jgi:hypothetical protein
MDTDADSKTQVIEADLSDSTHSEAIVQLIDEYAREEVATARRGLPPEVRERLGRGLRETANVFAIIAIQDSHVVGAGVCICGFSTFAARPVVNIHDLCWHSSGVLFTATNQNSIAKGVRTPAHGEVPAIAARPAEMLYRIEQGKYYGRPNPSRGEIVLNGGNPTAARDPFEVSRIAIRRADRRGGRSAIRPHLPGGLRTLETPSLRQWR